MKNKLILAGAVLLLGGFALGDAVNANLLAEIGSASGTTKSSEVRPAPVAGTAAACEATFKLVERKANEEIKTIKSRVAAAKKTKDMCVKTVREAAKIKRPSVSPKPSETSTNAI